MAAAIARLNELRKQSAEAKLAQGTSQKDSAQARSGASSTASARPGLPSPKVVGLPRKPFVPSGRAQASSTAGLMSSQAASSESTAEEELERKKQIRETAQKIAESSSRSLAISAQSQDSNGKLPDALPAPKVPDALPAPIVPPRPPLPGPDDPWPEPFWAGGSKRVLAWKDPATEAVIRFKAMLVEPGAKWGVKAREAKEASAADSTDTGANDVENSALPVFVYFCGMGSRGGFEELNVGMLQRLISVPFVLVAAVRDRLPWWVLSSRSHDWGWVDGELDPSQVRLWSNWVSRLLEEPSIDEDCCSLLGFSAGAYAITELLVSAGTSQWQPRAIVLGGVHGHGQSTDEGLCVVRQAKLPQIQQKWRAYLQRLSFHVGVPKGIFAVHCEEDSVCPWSEARQIFDTLERRQKQLGFPAVHLDLLDSTEVKFKKKSKSFHNYHDRTFCQESLLKHLLPTALRPRTPAETPLLEPTDFGGQEIASARANTGPVAKPILQRAAASRQVPSSSFPEAATAKHQPSLKQMPKPKPAPRARSRTPRRVLKMRGSVALVASGGSVAPPTN